MSVNAGFTKGNYFVEQGLFNCNGFTDIHHRHENQPAFGAQDVVDCHANELAVAAMGSITP